MDCAGLRGVKSSRLPWSSQFSIPGGYSRTAWAGSNSAAWFRFHSPQITGQQHPKVSNLLSVLSLFITTRSYTMPPRITQRRLMKILLGGSVHQYCEKHAWVSPSGDESGRMILGSTRTHRSSIWISCPSAGVYRCPTRWQSPSLQQDTPSGVLRPVYQSWAGAGFVVSRTISAASAAA
jgi:hypothetical protein